jgi:hypothetical protein
MSGVPSVASSVATRELFVDTPVFCAKVLFGISPSRFGVEQSGYNTADCFIL